MKTLFLRIAVAALLGFVAGAPGAAEYNTSFTYQGGLKASGVAVNAPVDLEFRIYSVATLGVPLTPPIVRPATPVVDGVFTVTLDFGIRTFARDERWLEVVVNNTILSPRQKLAPAPLAQAALQRAPLFFSGQIQESPYFSGNSGAYAMPNGITDAVYTENLAQMPIARACRARQLSVYHLSNGTYTDTTVALSVNGVATLLACGPVAQGGTCSNTVNTVNLAAGDLVSMYVTPNLPARPISNSENEIRAKVAFSWVCE